MWIITTLKGFGITPCMWEISMVSKFTLGLKHPVFEGPVHSRHSHTCGPILPVASSGQGEQITNWLPQLWSSTDRTIWKHCCNVCWPGGQFNWHSGLKTGLKTGPQSRARDRDVFWAASQYGAQFCAQNVNWIAPSALVLNLAQNSAQFHAQFRAQSS